MQFMSDSIILEKCKIGSRALRKARIHDLAQKFIKWASNLRVNSVEDYAAEFVSFCACHEIDAPQLRSLRDAIIFEVGNILDELDEQNRTKTKEVL